MFPNKMFVEMFTLFYQHLLTCLWLPLAYNFTPFSFGCILSLRSVSSEHLGMCLVNIGPAFTML